MSALKMIIEKKIKELTEKFQLEFGRSEDPNRTGYEYNTKMVFLLEILGELDSIEKENLKTV